jgi:hypothetical protein
MNSCNYFKVRNDLYAGRANFNVSLAIRISLNFIIERGYSTNG